MIVGTEWLIEAFDCEAERLREVETLRAVFAQIIADLGLKTVGSAVWHKFDGEGGVTGLAMLTESHLACHTYPEFKTATFNLYCCRSRPEWNWEANLMKMLGAAKIQIQKIKRGKNRNASVSLAVPAASCRRAAEERIFHNSHQNNRSNDRKFASYGDVKIRERGRIPHWEKEDGIYFVTFRLADSLPREILDKLEAEREHTRKVLDSLEHELSFVEKQKIDWMFSEKVEEYLDANYGECLLENSEIAKIVSDALKYFDNERYHLFAWCVMPNHVHVVFRAIQKNQLDEILHTWKSFTAHKINKILGREGRFWQREYYDRLVRNQEEFERIIQYVSDNPVKANLKDWNWVWAYGKYREAKVL